LAKSKPAIPAAAKKAVDAKVESNGATMKGICIDTSEHNFDLRNGRSFGSKTIDDGLVFDKAAWQSVILAPLASVMPALVERLLPFRQVDRAAVARTRSSRGLFPSGAGPFSFETQFGVVNQLRRK
jgi:hypothetical protein